MISICIFVASCINNKRKEKENIIEGLDGNTKDKILWTGYSTTFVFIGLSL